MSDLRAVTYDYIVPVTTSDTVDDPAGNFTGLLVGVSGNVVFWCIGGPSASMPITIAVVAGQCICVPCKRVGASTSATVYGLVSSIVRQGK